MSENDRRDPKLQEILDSIPGISKDFAESSDHPYSCRCNKCLDWWIKMGPDPDGNNFGSFSIAEIAAKLGISEQEVVSRYRMDEDLDDGDDEWCVIYDNDEDEIEFEEDFSIGLDDEEDEE